MVRNFGEKAFIATQAPVDCTIEKFWQMIWENDSRLIIMLCPIQAGSTSKVPHTYANIK
jgi:protein tyrosine phosphatase